MNPLNLLGDLYLFVVAGNQKALTAFVVAAVASFVARHGFTLDATYQGYLQALLLGGLAHLAVYFKSNKV